jgi:diguanylate cyclase (GGDEF)-like protein
MSQGPIDLHFDLKHLLKWRPPALRFDDIEEDHFNHVVMPFRLRHFILSGAIALIGFWLFLFSDQLMIPDAFDVAIKIRLYWFTPYALLLLFMGTFLRKVMVLLPFFVVETAVMVTGLGAAATMGWLLLHSNSPLAGMYAAGLMPIVIYSNLVQRFRFSYALVFSVSVILISIYCAVSRMGHVHPYSQFDWPLVLLVLVISTHSLVMNYRYELEERRRFQWSVRAQTLRKKLAASQAQLDDMSRRDPLTGVPNRRHFDEYIYKVWDEAAAADQELALLLMDVDHFKAFNDRYGHPAGDQCLRHVAQILQKAVPDSVGCVVRWGGEEFIVGLPGMDAQQAMRMAQSLCEAVQTSGLRHEASSTAQSVTISIGVAVVQPANGARNVDGLIAEADAALYRAKREGRNRCALALSPVPVS